jgi:general secretion pathway protein D
MQLSLNAGRRYSAFLLIAALLGACTNPSYRDGLEAMANGKKEAGIAALEKAAAESPRDAEIKASLIRHKSETINGYLATAESQRANGQPELAEASYRQVLAIEPRNQRAAQGLAQIATDRRNTALLLQGEQLLKKGDPMGAERAVRTVRTQDPLNPDARRLQQLIDRQRDQEQQASTPAVKAALAKPVVMEFRDASLKSVFEVLSRSSGLNFVFDKDVKGDTKVTLFVRNSPLEDIVRLILGTNQLAKSQLNENSFLIYPNTPAKAKEYSELVVRSFYLANADVKQAMAMIKAVAKSKDVFADEKLNLLIVKDTPDAMRLVERLIDSLDLAEPEVMLEVEVLEVSRSRLSDLGLNWPDSVSYGLLQNAITTTTATAAGYTTTTTPGGTLAPGYVNLQSTSGLTSFVANPALTLNIKAQNADTNVLANPRIRVKNREKAKIHIGEKLPVFTTTSTANVGVSASVNYLDTGLKLDVEPSVTLDDEVSIKVGLEVSSIIKEVSGPSGSMAYQLGTRSASTTLRLRNGETQVLAGLISDEERKATNHLPGLGEMPILGRLFGTHHDTTVKSEIILLITPRVVRNIQRPEFAQPTMPSGTEASVGAPPMIIRNSGPKSLGMSSSGSGMSAAATMGRAPSPVEPPDADDPPMQPAIQPPNQASDQPPVPPANAAAAPAGAAVVSPAPTAGSGAPLKFGGP